MKFYCVNCDSVIDEDDLSTVTECVGEMGGHNAYEEFNACPYCGSTEVMPAEDLDDEEDEEE